MDFIPSCDDRIDAVDTLARLYGTTNLSIESITGDKWPAFVEWEDGYSPFESWELLNYLFGVQLGVTWECRLTDAAFYHRTRYDGSDRWFYEGIKDAQFGAAKLLEYIRPQLKEQQFERALSCALANIADRDQGLNYVGPYAFNTFGEARAAEVAGLYYDVPEFLTGHRFWNQDFSDLVAGLIRENLKPVIVKFKAPVSDTERYVTSLWHYLYRVDHGMELIPLTHSKCSGEVLGSEILKIFPL
jgi:hypothetical protein